MLPFPDGWPLKGSHGVLIGIHEAHNRNMDRRRFLKSVSSAAGLAVAGLPARSVFAQTRTVNRVVVIGAGIIGSSIAYNLVKRGCEVVIVEKGLPAAQASGHNFGWINAAYSNTPSNYLSLRQRSLDEYRSLAEEVQIPVRWTGSLEWFQNETDEARMVADVGAVRAATDGPTSIIDAQRAAEIEPDVDIGGDWKLAHSTNDGAIDSGAATQALFDRSLAMGAQGALLSEVERVRERRRSVRVSTTIDTFNADLVVVAAGIGSAAIARMLDERVDSATLATPGIVVTTEPLPMMLNSVLYPPRVHIHQQSDGRVIIGEKGGPPDGDEHRSTLSGRPNVFPNDEIATPPALRLLALARQYVPKLADVRSADVGIGWRPMPPDRLPIVGHGSNAPNVYFATMHSGISLAPIIGKLAAAEILDGLRVAALESFRPSRF